MLAAHCFVPTNRQYQIQVYQANNNNRTMDDQLVNGSKQLSNNLVTHDVSARTLIIRCNEVFNIFNIIPVLVVSWDETRQIRSD